jgi:hypothetical protein
VRAVSSIAFAIEKRNVQLVCTLFNGEKEIKMKINAMMAVLSGVLLSATMTTSALAAAQKPAKMTCEEFVALDDVVKPKVVYWDEGFNKKGKLIDSVVDFDETDKLVPVLVTECNKTPKQSLSKTIKKHLANVKKPASTKKTVSAQKPTKMTCNEFVMLDDVVKPKVVYLAEGFNKKGKPIDSIVDFD